ncbi:hypothetical protein HYW73_01650 [Candidatus Nomurabacteria bacterium]|nr:hypothetical protein [Candidatus Nomurabacteria bacterium]
MNFCKNNLIIGSLALLAFVSIGVFGLMGWSHTASPLETPMMNCPYTENGYSVCENTLDHISKWQQFSNIVVPSIFILLIFAAVLYFIGKFNLFEPKAHFYKWKYDLYHKKLYSSPNRIIKWLSLFENSPSFLYARYS